MKTRAISAIIASPILVIPLLLGGQVLIGVLFIASMIGLFEFYRAYKIEELSLKLIGVLASIFYYVILIFGKEIYLPQFIGGFFVMLLISYVFIYPKYSLKDIMSVLIGFFYVVYLLSYIMQIRNESSYGVWLIWLVFVVAFGSDTFAYLVGKRFGKHKLAKKLSPKKTVEGSIGGVFGAIICSLLYGAILLYLGKVNTPMIFVTFAITGAVGSILAQIGDLAASAMKRQTGIKDFGKIMPGHGGILDRLDSIIFTAPFIYLIMKFFII